MYLEFYGFREQPFHITADPHFLYLSSSHQEALGAVVYGISHRKGFVAVTGEVGLGKTTIIRAYLEGADPTVRRDNQKVIYIFNANLSFIALLHTICRELERTPPNGETFEVVEYLHTVLIEEYRHGQTIVLVIDEVQNMPVDTLENLRMLSNLETSREKLIQIVLIGQPEFETQLKKPQLRQLDQRIAVRARIQPLNRQESRAYLLHRLSRVTDAPQTVFTPSAINQIVHAAEGAPRMLNILADNALIAGFGYQKKPVTSAIVRETIADYRGKKRSFGPFRRMAVPLGSALLVLALIPVVGRYPWPQIPKWIPFAPQQPVVSRMPVDRSTPEIKGAPILDQPPVETQTSDRQPIPLPPNTTHSGMDIPDSMETQKTASDVSTTDAPNDFVKPDSVSQLPVRHLVRKGESLTQISKEVYGFANAGTLRFILLNNPQIRDPNHLPTGVFLNLPPMVP